MSEGKGCFNCNYQDNTLRDGPCFKCGPSFKCWEPEAHAPTAGAVRCERCGYEFVGGCGVHVCVPVKPHTHIERALATQVGGGHYKDMPIQPVEFIHKNGIGFCEGAVIKYVSRWRVKNGLEDLKKARHFLDLLIEMEATR